MVNVFSWTKQQQNIMKSSVSRTVLLQFHAVCGHVMRDLSLKHALVVFCRIPSSLHVLRKIPTKTVTVRLKFFKKCIGQIKV